MLKTSSKIIISILLAVILFVGVGSFGIEKVHAYDAAAAQQFCGANDAQLGDPAAYQACIQQYIIDNTGQVQGPGFWTLFFSSNGGATDKKLWWGLGKSLVDVGAGLASLSGFASLAAGLALVLALLSGFLAIAGALLDASVAISIGGFKQLVTSSSIINSWTIIRDVLNISFIFVLLYIAITTIIGTTGTKTKVLIKDVIVGAILINFSMFFAEIIIDGGNILATALYNKVSALSYGSGVFGLTIPIMNSLKLQSLLKLSTVLKVSGQGNALFALFFSIILVGLTLWAFIYAAILFLIRNVMLLFLMAISPIGFMGGTLPWFEEKSSEWWASLIGQVTVAPFFLFVVFMLINLINGIKGGDSIGQNITQDLQNFYTGDSGNINYTMFINAFLIIGMLLVGTKMTKKLSGKVGEIVMKGMNIALQLAVGAATAGAAAVAAKGATTADSGLAMAAKGTARRASFAHLPNGIAYRGAVKMQNQGRNMQLIGNAQKFAGNVLSGQSFKNLAEQPNAIGTALTDMKDSFFKGTKKHSEIDLEAAFKYKDKMEKDYEKRYGEIANRIGGKKESDQLKTLQDISKNIQSQAETLHKREPANKRLWDRMEAMTDPALKNAERKRLAALMKTDVDNNKAPAVAQQMGVDLTAHKAKQDELKITIEQRTQEKNKYIKEMPEKYKKIKDTLRSKPSYESKDEFATNMDKAMKAWLKANPQTPPAATP